MHKIVLASSSPYRRALLEKLTIPFYFHTSDINRMPAVGADAEKIVHRLAIAKAKALAKHYPRYLIIGADQALWLFLVYKSSERVVYSAD